MSDKLVILSGRERSYRGSKFTVRTMLSLWWKSIMSDCNATYTNGKVLLIRSFDNVGGGGLR